MRPQTRTTRVVSALTMLGVMMVGGQAAHASSATIGIKGGIVAGGGDPPYTYVFDVYLTGGTLAPDNGTQSATFTIDGLVGVSSASFAAASPLDSNGNHTVSPSTYSQPPGTAAPNSPQASEIWTVPCGGITTAYIPPFTGPPNGYNYASNITWDYVLGPTLTASGPDGTFLGVFTVVTGWNTYSSPPVTPGVTVINYSFDLNGSTGQSEPGSPTSPPIIIQNGAPTPVPEPSSMILMLMAGGVGLPYLAIRRRGRGPSRRSA